jgi:NADH-quinone oxidoreductase subunit L
VDNLHQLAPALILAFPLLGAVVALFTERSKPRMTAVVSTVAIGLSFLVAATLVVPAVWSKAPADLAKEIASHAPFSWMTTGNTEIRLGFHIDHLAAAMLFMVTMASTLIHVFSNGYMAGETRFAELFRWIGFFTFSMLGLIVSDNLLTLFVCWELMGVSSYKLIGFFYQKPSAQEACKKAFMTTRIGDIGMFVAILMLYAKVGSFRYAEIFAAVDSGLLAQDTCLLVSIGLFFGAMGKSAQFPLHVWLPDAMEGPTPVSALIHAATMVAAGVYLVGRMFPVFSAHPLALPLVCGVGTFTALFAGTMAVTATDIKKVLAYSTVSQLGFMFAGLGAGGIAGYYAGMFHLVTHAFFKACLFLGSGSVIHAVHTQEIGQMGGLRRKMPVTFVTWTISTLAIAGVPFTAGFFSKDSILLALAIDEGPYAQFRLACMGLLLAGAFLTAAYMTRVTWLTFMGEPREKERFDHAHESKLLVVPLVFLGIMAIAAGYAWHGRFLRPENLLPGMGHWPAEVPAGLSGAALDVATKLKERYDHWHHLLMVPAIGAGVGGIALGAFLYGTGAGAALRAKVRGPLAPVFTVWRAKYWIDEIYWATFVAGSNAVSRMLAWWDRNVVDGVVNAVGRIAVRVGDAAGWTDREIVDGQFVHGAAGVATGLGSAFSTMQGGKVRVYLYQAVLATAVVALFIAAVYG